MLLDGTYRIFYKGIMKFYYKINAEGLATDLSLDSPTINKGETLKSVESNSMPNIETLHTKSYLDAQIAIQYKADRRKEYASVADQLDMQYHDSVNGTNTWVTHVAEVKLKFPKPKEV